jgi:hypothetical protein
MKHTVAKLFHRMQRRTERTAGSLAILIGEERKFIQFFSVNIAAFGLKKAARRKAGEIFLAGFELIRPHDAHGLVRPRTGAGIALP